MGILLDKYNEWVIKQRIEELKKAIKRCITPARQQELEELESKLQK